MGLGFLLRDALFTTEVNTLLVVTDVVVGADSCHLDLKRKQGSGLRE